MLPRLATRAAMLPRLALTRSVASPLLAARLPLVPGPARAVAIVAPRWYASAAIKTVEADETDFFAEPEASMPERSFASSEPAATPLRASRKPRSSRSTPATESADSFFDDATSASSSPSTSSSLESAPGPRANDVVDNIVPFDTLKGRINHDTLKALTFKPFQLTAMSEVQKRVLKLMPGLAGQKLRGQAKEEAIANGEIIPGQEGQGQEWAERRDLLVKAKTGTGKTLAFLVPAIDARLSQIDRLTSIPPADLPEGRAFDGAVRGQLHRNITRTRVGTVIISPTRELATQIANEALKVCTWHKDFNVHLLVGGGSRAQQLKDWRRTRKDIVVATPGRLEDMLSEPEVREAMEHTDLLILDEADTLLEMGFSKSLNNIIERLPEDRQTFLFSATVSKAIAEIARKSLRPDHILIDCVPKNESNTHAHIPQRYSVVPPEAQLAHILRLIALDQLSKPDSKIILFLPTTKLTMLFATMIRELKDLLPHRMEVREIHSGLGQNQRSRASDRFRADKRPSILVTSDVSARGVDYPNVSRVIQVGVPSSSEQYVHRVGRTGRGSSKSGCGDWVLAPFEAGFVGNEMKAFPITPTSAADVTAELVSAAEAAGQGEYASKMGTELEAAVADFLPKLDSEAIEEVFSSMLGYYAGKQAEMRCFGNELIGGLQEWAVKGAGMVEAPHVGQGLMNKLGLNKRSDFGRGSAGFGGRGKFGNDKRGGGGFGGGGGFRGGSGGYGGRKDMGERSGGFGRSGGGGMRSEGGGLGGGFGGERGSERGGFGGSGGRSGGNRSAPWNKRGRV